MNALSVEFWRSEQELLANRATWDEIFDASRASAYLSFEWLSACWRFFREGQTPLIGLVREGTVPVALVPLELAPEKVGPVPFRVLRFLLSGDWCLQTGALVKESYGADRELHIVETVIAASREAGHDWEYARLDGFPARKVSQDPPAAGLTRVARLTGPAVVIKTRATWEEYKATLSSAHRQNIARRIRAMERKGRVRMERTGSTPSADLAPLDRLLNDALSVSQRSWQHTAPKGWAISKNSNPAFFREVSTQLAAHGLLDLSVLYLDDQPISYIWGPARWPHTSIYKPGFDESLSDLAPGLVHIAKLVEDSISRRFEEIDYGAQFFDYKSKWSKSYEDLCALYYYPSALKPTLLRLFRSLRHARGPAGPRAQ